jgi:hypothetical protein
LHQFHKWLPQHLHRQFIFGSAYVAAHPYAIADAAEDVESLLEMELAHYKAAHQGGGCQRNGVRPVMWSGNIA